MAKIKAVDVDMETGEVRRFPHVVVEVRRGPLVPQGEPVAMPLGVSKPESLHEVILRQVRAELLQRPAVPGTEDPLIDDDFLGDEEAVEDLKLTSGELDYLLSQLEVRARHKEKAAAAAAKKNPAPPVVPPPPVAGAPPPPQQPAAQAAPSQAPIQGPGSPVAKG